MSAYKIGLAVIGIFTIALLLLVGVQAGSTKADNESYKKATDAAEKINSYISSKQKIPADLSSAGLNDVGDNITYHKDSDASYTFCVTYKSKSNGFDPSYVTSDLTSAALGTSGFSDGTSSPYSNKSTLYIDSIHNKGKVCQTIKPVLYGSYNSTSPAPLPSTNCVLDPTSDSQAAYDAYYNCLDAAYPTTSSP